MPPKIANVYISDHAKQRIKNNNRIDLDDYNHVHSVRELAEWVVEHGDRLHELGGDLKRWADKNRQRHVSDVYYLYQNRVFGYSREYRTFLKESVNVKLVTVLYHPFKENDPYYGEKLLDKDLPDYDSISDGWLRFLKDQILFWRD